MYPQQDLRTGVDLDAKTAGSDCDVLIAGYGPVGATLAALLGRSGLSVVVAEPAMEVYPLPRAAHLDHEIMRIFQMIGIVEAVRPHLRQAPDYEFRTAGGVPLMRIERTGVIGASGWPVSFNCYQPGIEGAIRDAVAALPNVRVLHGTRLTDFLQADMADGVVVTLQDGRSSIRMKSRFLVGCDGAKSMVRESCKIGLHDYEFDEPWLVVDAKVPDERGFPRENLQICDPERPTSFVHMGPGRLRWEFMLKPGEDAEAMMSDETLAVLLAPWRRLGTIEIERRAVYRFHGLVARRWREGRVFLAGDAAHQMPPFMGQGLCSGLRDAANLAWKLKLALAGGQTDALLDSYQTEREPHVRFIIEKAIEMGRVVCMLDAHNAAARDAKMSQAPQSGRPVVFPRLTEGCLHGKNQAAGTIFPQAIDVLAGTYLDDWLQAGPWLLHRGEAPSVAGRTAVRIIEAATLPPAFADAVLCWLAECDADAVLVRPDRYVFGTGCADLLLNAYDDWCSPDTPKPSGACALDQVCSETFGSM